MFSVSVSGDNVKAVSSDLTSLHHKAFDLLFVYNTEVEHIFFHWILQRCLVAAWSKKKVIVFFLCEIC